MIERPDILITITDMRELYCVRGLRKSFESHGLDFERFIRSGMMSSELYGHGSDALIDRVIESKLERQNGK